MKSTTFIELRRHWISVVRMVTTGLLIATSPALAVTILGHPPGAFSSPTMWDNGKVPGLTDLALLSGGGTVTFTPGLTMVGSLEVASTFMPITFANATTDAGLAVEGDTFVAGEGNLNLNSGFTFTANNLKIGYFAHNPGGSYLPSTVGVFPGASLLAYGHTVLGANFDSGYLYVSGQAHFADVTVNSDGSSGSRIYVTDGGRVTVNGPLVAGPGHAQLFVDGANSSITLSSNKTLQLGTNALLRLSAGGTYTGGSNGSTTVSPLGVLDVADGHFIANGNVYINGGTLLGGSSSAFDLGSHKLQMTGGTASFNNLDIPSSGIVDAARGAEIHIASNLSITRNGQVRVEDALLHASSIKIGPDGTLTAAPQAKLDFSTLELAGGTFSGILLNRDTIVLSATSYVVGDVDNANTMILRRGSELVLQGSIVNNSHVQMDGGGLSGSDGHIVNNGTLDGQGIITAELINNASIAVGGGNLTLVRSAGYGDVNYGSIELATGRQLVLQGQPLHNYGTISLNSGVVAGTGTLVNSGGVVKGQGTIIAPFENGGTLDTNGGIVTVTRWSDTAFGAANAGLIQMEHGSNLTGGTFTNVGRIEGEGAVGGMDINRGTIEAMGSLQLPALATNAGLITAGAGGRLVTGHDVANFGTIYLAGGVIDTMGHTLRNAAGSTTVGELLGYGTINGLALENRGTVVFTGGATTVNASVVNFSEMQFKFDAVLFTDAVINYGTMHNESAKVTFARSYVEHGTYISDPADNYFTTLDVTSSGALVGGEGDRFIVSENFKNESERSAIWDTSSAQLLFTSADHEMQLRGVDLGSTAEGLRHNYAWESIELARGGTLNLHDQTAGHNAALYTKAFLLDGGLSQLASVHANGVRVYYDPSDVRNFYLHAASYELGEGGFLAPIPEPTTASLALIGATAFAAMCVCRRRIQATGL